MKVGHKRENYKPNNEYYTPAWVFETLAIEFDLDVASPHEKTHVPAKTRYCACCNDGLTNNWFGNVWMNPPFSPMKPWVDKFLHHPSGIALLPLYRSNSLMEIWNYADGVTLLTNKMAFEHPELGKKAIFSPVALFAKGSHNIEALRRIGRVH